MEFGLLALGLFLAGWLSRRAGLSPVVGYLALGLLAGPHGPVPIYRIGPVTSLLGELGLVLLLFFLGLEFSLGRLIEGGRATLRAGLVDLALLPIGVATGWLLGFGPLASLFLGAAVYVSSSGVIARFLGERSLIAYPEAERTLGVLVFEDLAMVAVLAGLGLALGGPVWPRLAGAVATLALFALLLRFGRPAVRRLFAREGEALVLVSLGALLLAVGGAAALGFPEAVAAFLCGLVAAEAGAAAALERHLRGWYDVAAAAFFVEFALHVDLGAAARQLPVAVALVLVTVLAQMTSGALAGRATGLSLRASLGHGLMLLPRGEFSLVVVGVAAGAEALVAGERAALEGAVSLYVVLMVVLSSAVMARYDPINGWLARRLGGRARRRREADRPSALEDITLE